MQNLPEFVAALIFALLLTFGDRIFVSGPYLGSAGFLVSTIAGVAGWYLARWASRSISNRHLPTGNFGVTPEVVFAASAALIFAAFAYFKLFDLTKVDYTSADVFYHLLLIVLAAFVIRMAGHSVGAMAA